MEFAVQISNLSKDYKTGFLTKKTNRALDGLSLNVRQGQIFGFLGGNGAGKTTTIKILMGLLYPTSGEAKILGQNISEIDVHQHLGYCPENPYFYDYLTPLELLNYFGEIFGLSREKRKERCAELLNAVGLLESDWNRHLRKFSKGMMQRVGLAQSLLNDPKIVFLDEPMSGLDPIGRREIRELIANLRTEGKTVFMSTHILSDIESLCDEVAILRHGKLAATGNLQDLLRGENEQSQFEVTVTHIDVTQFRSNIIGTVEINEQANGAIVSCSDEDVQNVIKTVRSAGGKLISVQQVKQSLEDLFTGNYS